jgi:hypothetical protein
MEQHRVLSEIRTNSPQFARFGEAEKHAGGNHNNVIDL